MAEVVRLPMRREVILDAKLVDIRIWRKTVVADLTVLSREPHGEMNAIKISVCRVAKVRTEHLPNTSLHH